MTKILEAGDLQHTEVRQNAYRLCCTEKRELICNIRRESAKDLRMTAWDLVRLTEGSEVRQGWDRIAASSEARLQYCGVMVWPIAPSQRTWAITNCKDIYCALVS